MKSNIVLIGMMGTFKSSVAKILAKKINMDGLVDTDEAIEKSCGASVSQIFSSFGEQGFRDRETTLIKSLENGKNLIISCGGGVVLREENIASLKVNGWVVRLTADAERIFERVKNGGSRPLLDGKMTVENIAQLCDARESLYDSAADLTVDNTSLTPKQTAKIIIKEWEAIKKGLAEKI